MACKEQQENFSNVALLADSLYVFIETTLTSLMQIQLIFFTQIKFSLIAGANQQNIELVTLIQDAVFLYPQRFADGTKKRYLLENKKLKVLFG
jgi:hypothetical protein